jgi:hypothetical protein
VPVNNWAHVGPWGERALGARRPRGNGQSLEIGKGTGALCIRTTCNVYYGAKPSRTINLHKKKKKKKKKKLRVPDSFHHELSRLDSFLRCNSWVRMSRWVDQYWCVGVCGVSGLGLGQCWGWDHVYSFLCHFYTVADLFFCVFDQYIRKNLPW